MYYSYSYWCISEYNEWPEKKNQYDVMQSNSPPIKSDLI